MAAKIPNITKEITITKTHKQKQINKQEAPQKILN